MRSILVACACIAASGCCSTSRCYLARAQTALEASDPIAIRAIGAVCKPRVESECRGRGEDCEAYRRCRAAVVGYRASRKVIGDAIVEINRSLAELGVR